MRTLDKIHMNDNPRDIFAKVVIIEKLKASSTSILSSRLEDKGILTLTLCDQIEVSAEMKRV